MSWVRRLLIASPFAAATVLNVLIVVADRFRLRSEHIAGYGFLFFSPWAWLLDHPWWGNIHSRLLDEIITYTVLLWIPAALYSACIWLLFRLVSFATGRGLSRADGTRKRAGL